jgi:hypothetical protein
VSRELVDIARLSGFPVCLPDKYQNVPVIVLTKIPEEVAIELQGFHRLRVFSKATGAHLGLVGPMVEEMLREDAVDGE